MDITSNTTALKNETPHARPSSPSRRFTEFITRTIHKTVSGIAKSPRCCVPNIVVYSIAPPQNAVSVATAICAKSLSHAGRLKISSSTPTAQIISPPTEVTRTILGISSKMRSEAQSAATINPIAIAIPPRRGVGARWNFLSWSGTSTAPVFFASIFVMGVNKNVMISDTASIAR